MKPLSRQEYLNLTPQQQANFCKVMEGGIEKYYLQAVPFTPGTIPSLASINMATGPGRGQPSFAIMDDPYRDPITPVEVDIAFIEGFLSSNQYLTQSRRFRNIQISHNQQQREIETLKKNLNKTANHLRDSENDVQLHSDMVAQAEKIIQNLKAELAEITKQLKEAKKKTRVRR